MNPYAPPQTIAEPTTGPRLLVAEANVRGIGLYDLCGGLAFLVTALMAKGADRYVDAVIMVMNVAAGIQLLRLRRQGRVLELIANVSSFANGLLALGTGPRTGAQLLGLGFGTAISGWVLWYLYFGRGARVLAPSYAELLAATPEPPPRIAGWAKVVATFLVLGGALTLLAWSFFSDVPRTR